MEVIAIASFVLFIVVMKWVVETLAETKRLEKMLNGIPGPSGLPILGNLLDVIGSVEEFLFTLERWSLKYGGIYRMWLGTECNIVISDPASVEKVLSSSINIEKPDTYDPVRAWLGNGLLVSRGNLWRERRKMLTPCFHLKIFLENMPVFNSNAETLLSKFRSKMADSHQVEVCEIFKEHNLEVISEIAMGAGVSGASFSGKKYLKTVQRMSELTTYRCFRPWLSSRLAWALTSHGREEVKLRKFLKQFTLEVIESRKQARRNKEAETEEEKLGMRSFMDMLLDVSRNDPNFTIDDIREETETFLFAGHDTTATALIWATYFLSRNPSCQKKLQAELDEVFGEDRHRELTKEDVDKLKYLELCIKETLRIHPVVPIFARKLTTEIEFDNGYKIPEGATATIVSYLMHHSPKLYDSPLEFRPERFLETPRTFSYVPFSAGPRKCIGQKYAMLEMKVALAKLMVNFNIMSSTDKNIKYTLDLVLRPKNDELFLNVFPREQKL